MANTPLWEWVVARDAHGGSAGVCRTRHGAMQAMTEALIRARRPRTGHVAQVILTNPPHRPPYYLRCYPEHTAVYDGQAIQWR